MAPTTTPPATGQPKAELDPPRSPRRSVLNWSPWLWPAAAISVVAVADEAWGTPGAITCFGIILAVSCLTVGRLFERVVRFRISLLSFAIGGTAILVAAALASISQVKTGPPDLRGKNVTQQQIRRLNLRGGLLAGARLTGLDLRRNSLAGTSAPGAVLAHARLDGVNMRGADLRGADLSGACLRGADLMGASLSGAWIESAYLGETPLPPYNGALGHPAGTPPAQCR